eukprot:TRINITY_DN2277_c0_g1_i1.p2 TRINITY_DN2277_c0_g1~~TRINITY_DN2277_c0_g1_i1.p2  ORF type:complete len:142 (+),score=33.49 TRINITY_DN2277_c0_g1_i1:55-426(+)
MGWGGDGKGGGWGAFNWMALAKMMKGKGKGGGGWSRRPSNELCVWLAGLPEGPRDKDLNKKLQEHMKQAGECTWASIGKNGQGHAAFKTKEEVANAVATLNGSTFEGLTLTVDVWTKQEKTEA